MAFNFEYPYTDPSRYNADWLLNETKRVGALVDELNARYASLEKLLEEANAYTDTKCAALQVQIDANVTAISNLKKELAAAESRINTRISEEIETVNVSMDAKYLRLSQMISQMWEDMKAYIAGQVFDIKVRNFFTGDLTSIQAMVDYLAHLHLENSGTYDSVSGKNTYTHYVAKNESYENVVLNSETFFNS